jgi:hypothetical protein
LTAARLKTQLLRSLDSYLNPLGFRRVSDKFFGDRYYRDEGGVRQGFHVSTRARGNGLEAELPYVTVRFAPVEELVASLEEPHPLTTPAGIAARATLTVLTSSHGGFVHKTWMIRSAEEVGQVAEQIANQAIAKGIPVFKTFSNAEQALAILAADDEQARSYSAPDEVRAKNAVALAFLLHGKDAAKLIAQKKAARLHGEGLSTFTHWMGRFLSSLAKEEA